MTADVSAHAEAQGGVTRWVGGDRSFRPSCSIKTSWMIWSWVKLGDLSDPMGPPMWSFSYWASSICWTIHINPYHQRVEFWPIPTPLDSSVDHCMNSVTQLVTFSKGRRCDSVSRRSSPEPPTTSAKQTASFWLRITIPSLCKAPWFVAAMKKRGMVLHTVAGTWLELGPNRETKKSLEGQA